MRLSKIKNNQNGFASIVIAIVLILVLSLITVGFAELMRNNERQALNKQLSAQAYYAAESGVNDAAKAISMGYSAAKTQCDSGGVDSTQPGASYLSGSNNIVGNATQATYTCLLIDRAPMEVQYAHGTVNTRSSKVTELSGVDPADGITPVVIKSLVFTWQADSDPSGFWPTTCSSSCFPPADQWTYTGVLRIALTPLVSGQLSRDYFNTNTYTAFLYPSAGGTNTKSVSTSASSGDVISGNCSSDCSVTITNLSSANYIVDMRAIYNNVNVRISAYGLDGTGTVATGNQLKIKNAQYLVDSTGKAQNILKRIQVRIPAHNGYLHPDYTLDNGTNICKQLDVWPGGGNNNPSCLGS